MTKTVIYTTTVLMLLGGIFFGCKSKTAPKQLSGTILEVSDSIINNCLADTFNLGSIKHGETVSKEFAVKNSSSKPFIINKVDADCGCLATDFEKKPVKPGESTGLSVSFASKGYRGYTLKKVSVMTTACEKPLVFYIEAEVK